MANRLEKETSPYLLQHKNNPVDWYPWGDEALELSVERNKPIFLSIGYSACHWCHVMEHESFENAEIAELMNKNFICIKVDREERPDLDHIYQNVAQALTRGGGWPLTVFLTPARKPFFGGTYFPPEDRYGRPGLKRVLQNLTKAYETDPMGVAQNAMKLTAFIQAAETVSNTVSEKKFPEWSEFEALTENLLSQVDWENGGLGSAPKFPNPMMFSFFWRYSSLFNHEKAREAAVLTLRKMAQGGIYDHLGGGFSRYSVDQSWSVPHFEKMLYDNGLLLKLYSEVLLTPGDYFSAEDRILFLNTVKQSVDYVLREMISEDGGFYAAQDADSEGEEGKFFAWSLSEVETVLSSSETDRKIFIKRFGVTEEGNFEHHTNVLYLATPTAEIAQELGLKLSEVEESLARSTASMFQCRDQRVKPGTDNKVLTSWNGLMIGGLAWASQALKQAGFGEESTRALQAATRAFELVCRELTSGQDGQLSSTFQGGQAKLNAHLDDYAFMAMGALDLARFVSEESLMTRAERMAQLWIKRVLRRFKTENSTGYYFTSDDHEELIHRPKSIFDQAIPSGTAVVLESLIALSEIDADGATPWSDEVQKQLGSLWDQVKNNPYGSAEMINAAMLSLVGPVVLSGPGTESLVKNPFVFRKHEFKLRGKSSDNSKLLVCHKQTCSEFFSSLGELEREMSLKLVGNSTR
jgi:uncharacterized protein YyaL (SSP411 family)